MLSMDKPDAEGIWGNFLRQLSWYFGTKWNRSERRKVPLEVAYFFQ
jgi:hypothetical protein